MYIKPWWSVLVLNSNQHLFTASSWWAVSKPWCVQGREEGEKNKVPSPDRVPEKTHLEAGYEGRQWLGNVDSLLRHREVISGQTKAGGKQSITAWRGEGGEPPGRSLLRDCVMGLLALGKHCYVVPPQQALKSSHSLRPGSPAEMDLFIFNRDYLRWLCFQKLMCS